LVDEIVTEFRRELERRERAGALDLGMTVTPRGLALQAADFIGAHASNGSALASRIGPVFTTDRLATLLAPSPDRPLTTEAVRERAASCRLVAFRSDDDRWLYPDWQFDRVHGQLVVNLEVIALWRRLPHGAWMDAIDLAVWMNTELRSLTAAPQRHVRGRGTDEPLEAAIARLQARCP
jgi:hypothetical protein